MRHPDGCAILRASLSDWKGAIGLHYKPLWAAALLCLLVLLPMGIRAENRFYDFTLDTVPSELLETSHAVGEEKTTITLTFAGDCTLGGETANRGSRNSFRSRIAKNGMNYPFQQLQALFATDDFTVVNLEGVLSDAPLKKTIKTYNFIGDADYTNILTAGSVECVNLANNHTLDFGKQGYLDTVTALNAAGIGHFDENTMLVVEKDGVRIGMTGTLFSMSLRKQNLLARQLQLLKDIGCAAVIHSMHAGNEYAKKPSLNQKKIVKAAVELGATLVVGHHPHIVQGVALEGNVPVVYSLGNCSFGGNFDPPDYHAALLRAELRFSDGALAELNWSLYPISVSGNSKVNNFQPVLLLGEEAQDVILKIQDASTMMLAPFEDEQGAKQPSIFYQ